jgi:predicted Holliday junction resolvase-like endonuclease
MIIYFLLGLLAILILSLIIYLAQSNAIVEKTIQKQLDSRFSLIKNEMAEQEKNKYDLLLSEWQTSNEINIRREAIAVNGRQITNEVWDETTLLKDNFSFNPRDIKFVGKFIDLVVFDGATEETEVSIYFISIIKASHPPAYAHKDKVKEAISKLKYNWQEINLPIT